MPSSPRLRLFAGPNGSGKTTLTRRLRQHRSLDLGHYVNPDEIAASLTSSPQFEDDEVERFRRAQALAREKREEFLAQCQSMTYESVMSHESHLEFVTRAKRNGFCAYLYYIGIADPSICEQRVAQRVAQGGHPVPREKIYARYQRSLNNLADMCAAVDRGDIWDNTGQAHIWVGRVDAGRLTAFRSRLDQVGQAPWFMHHLWERWPTARRRLVEDPTISG